MRFNITGMKRQEDAGAERRHWGDSIKEMGLLCVAFLLLCLGVLQNGHGQGTRESV